MSTGRQAERKKTEAHRRGRPGEPRPGARPTTTTNILAAKANVELARASVRDAEIDLGYCRMSAPIDGRIGEALVKVGNLVGPVRRGIHRTGHHPAARPDGRRRPPQLPLPDQRHASSSQRASTSTLGRREAEGAPRRQGKSNFIDNTVDRTTSTFLMKAHDPQPRLPALARRIRQGVPGRRHRARTPRSSSPSRRSWRARPARPSTSSARREVVGVARVEGGRHLQGPARDRLGPGAGRAGDRRGHPTRPARPENQAAPSRPDRPGRASGKKAETPLRPRTGGDGPPPPHRRIKSKFSFLWADFPSSPCESFASMRATLTPPVRPLHAMVNFFIERPIFSTVLAILMVLVGGICVFLLPISLYPEIVPPQVQITTTYTGADAMTRRRDRDHTDRAEDQRRQGDDLHPPPTARATASPRSSPPSTSATPWTSPPSTSRTRSRPPRPRSRARLSSPASRSRRRRPTWSASST